MRTALASLLLLALATTPGCASIAMQGVFWRAADPPKMLPDPFCGVHLYAGTALDLGILGWVLGIKQIPQERRDAQDGAWAMLLFDLPWSLLGDTLLLPMTICQQIGIIPQPTRQ
jgi:uncharacterized protein YceK